MGTKGKQQKLPDRVEREAISVRDRLIELDKEQPLAVLATESDGQPYTSLIAYALTPDAEGVVFLTPRSTRKYRNIRKNENVALLIDSRKNRPEDYLSADSISILGKAYPMRKSEKRSSLETIITKKHPVLRKIMDSPETALILVKIHLCIHVTGFQRVSVWEVRS